jgi:predicted nucleic acid-binding Zn ribbon protein
VRGYADAVVKDEGFQRLSTVIGETLRRMHPPQEVLVAQIQAAWPALVGALVAEQTKPVAIDKGALIVHVKNHMWLAELRGGLAQNVLQALQAQHAPQVKRIAWRVDPLE